MIYFNSDYTAGAHPKVLERLVKTNLEHTVGYGNDQYTAHAKALIREEILHFVQNDKPQPRHLEQSERSQGLRNGRRSY